MFLRAFAVRRCLWLASMLFGLGLTSTAWVHAQAVKELTGHHKAVAAVAFRPDGRQVCSASFDFTLRFWDARTGELVNRAEGHQGRVLALAYNPACTRVASAGIDGRICLWTNTGQPCCTLPTTELAIHVLVFTPDGKQLLAAGESGHIEVWDFQTQASTSKASMGSKGLRSLFSPPATYRRLVGAPTPLYALALSPDGTTVASAGRDGQVRLLNLLNGKSLRSFDVGVDIYSLAFSPDGTRLLAGAGDGSVRGWDMATEKPLPTFLPGLQQPIYGVGFNGDGRRWVSAGLDGQLIIWDATTGTPVHRHRLPERALCAVLSPDGRQILAGTGRARCFLLELPRHAR